MMKLMLMLCLGPLSLCASTTNINAGFPFSPVSVTVTSGDTIHIDFLGGFHNAAETNDPIPSNSNVYNGTGFRSGNGGAVATFDFVPVDGPHYYFCEVHGGAAMHGYIFVATPTPTQTPTPTETPTFSISPTFTESETFTFSPTITDTWTDSPTPTITDTFTDGPSPTITVTPSNTPTITQTATASATASASPTTSCTFTVTPVYAPAPGDHTILGPVPVKAGMPLCLAFPQAPFHTTCELFNSRGERVAKGEFNSELNQCLGTQNLSPGLYFADIEEDDINQKHSIHRQKIVVLP